MKLLHIIFFCLLAGSSLTVLAQENSSQLTGTAQAAPSPPFVAASLPDWCEWTVDYKYAPSSAPAAPDPVEAYRKLAAQDPALAKAMQNPQFVFGLNPPKPLRRVIIKTGTISHEVETLDRGFQHETWTIGDTVVEQLPQSPKLAVRTGSLNAGNIFPEFEWLSASNFTRRETVNGVDCLLFQQRLNPLDVLIPGVGVEAADSVKVMVTAVIAEKSRLPIALYMGGETRQYTYLSPPANMLVPAPEFVAAAEELKGRIEEATRPLSPP